MNEPKTITTPNRGLKIYAILVTVLFLICFVAYFAAERNTEPDAENSIDSSTILHDIDHPKGEVFEGELEFLDLHHNQLGIVLSTVEHPDIPDAHRLHAETEYIIRANYPNLLLAELENGDTDFTIDATYDFEVEAGELVHALVRIYNENSGNLYLLRGQIPAADDLCLKHSVGVSGSYLSSYPEFRSEDFCFTIWTSALPDAGPKTTSDASYGEYSLHYTLAGVTDAEWGISAN